MSPTAKTRRLVTLRRPRSVAMPAGDARTLPASSASPSRFGRRPTATSRWLPAMRRPSASTSVGPGSTRARPAHAFHDLGFRRRRPGAFAATRTPRAVSAARRPSASSGILAAGDASGLHQGDAASPGRRRRPPSPARSARRPGSAGAPAGAAGRTASRWSGTGRASRPGIGGTAARLPAATTMRRAVRRRPSTPSVSGSTKRASPRSTVAPSARKRASESIGAIAAMAPARARAPRPSRSPVPAERRPKRPAARVVCGGMRRGQQRLAGGTQPVLRQSPPMRSRSISATFRPSCAATAVTDSPAAAGADHREVELSHCAVASSRRHHRRGSTGSSRPQATSGSSTRGEKITAEIGRAAGRQHAGRRRRRSRRTRTSPG